MVPDPASFSRTGRFDSADVDYRPLNLPARLNEDVLGLQA